MLGSVRAQGACGARRGQVWAEPPGVPQQPPPPPPACWEPFGKSEMPQGKSPSRHLEEAAVPKPGQAAWFSFWLPRDLAMTMRMRMGTSLGHPKPVPAWLAVFGSLHLRLQQAVRSPGNGLCIGSAVFGCLWCSRETRWSALLRPRCARQGPAKGQWLSQTTPCPSPVRALLVHPAHWACGQACAPQPGVHPALLCPGPFVDPGRGWGSCSKGCLRRCLHGQVRLRPPIAGSPSLLPSGTCLNGHSGWRTLPHRRLCSCSCPETPSIFPLPPWALLVVLLFPPGVRGGGTRASPFHGSIPPAPLTPRQAAGGLVLGPLSTLPGPQAQR